MAKEYRYRKHIRWGQYFIFPYFIVLAAVCCMVLFFLWSRRFLLLPYRAFSAVTAAIWLVLLLEAVIIWYMYYRLAGTSVCIENATLVYKVRKKEIRIPINRITVLRFPSLDYLGGWIKIISPEKSIRLTVVLENSAGFLQELKTSLDNQGLQGVYDRHRFFRFLKTAVFSDQSWTRLYAIFWKLNLIIGISGLIAFDFAILAEITVIKTILWIIVSVIWPILFYLVSEAVFARKIAVCSSEEGFNFPAQDFVYEDIIYKKITFWGILIYFFVSAVIFILLRR